MRLHWVTAVLLSSALVSGCGDRNSQNAQNSNDPNAGPAASAPAEQPAPRSGDEVSPDRDGFRPDTEGTRATTGSSARARTGSTRAPDRRASGSAVAPTPRESSGNAAASRSNAASPTVASRPEFNEVTVPSGTQLPLELITPLSSETATIETPVRARLRNAVTVNGYTAIPAGTVLNGTVTDVAEAGRVKGRAHLAFRFNEATIHGVREDLRTNPISFEAESTKGKDATKIGAGAGIGAAIGGILGGGSGAAKGAAIGGAAGTGAVLATRGSQVSLAEGADLSAVLSDSLTVRVPAK